MLSRIFFILLFGLAVIVSASMAKAQSTKPIRCLLPNSQSGYLIRLVLGDTSGDGYDKIRSEIVCSSKDNKEIQAIYNKFSTRAGLDLINEVATDYEDSWLSVEQTELLKKAGVLLPSDLQDAYDDVEEMYNLDPEHWFALYIGILKAEDPSLVLELLNPADLDIGGYGILQ